MGNLRGSAVCVHFSCKSPYFFNLHNFTAILCMFHSQRLQVSTSSRLLDSGRHKYCFDITNVLRIQAQTIFTQNYSAQWSSTRGERALSEVKRMLEERRKFWKNFQVILTWKWTFYQSQHVWRELSQWLPDRDPIGCVSAPFCLRIWRNLCKHAECLHDAREMGHA